MLIFQSLDLEQMSTWRNFLLGKSAISHSIKLPFDGEVAEKILNAIYSGMSASDKQQSGLLGSLVNQR